MSFNRLVWEDRRVEFPNRFKLTYNPDGTVDLEERPGIIENEGTPITAGHLNRIEEGIESHIADTALHGFMVPLRVFKDDFAWVAGKDLPTQRNYPATAAVDGVIYVIGGISKTNVRYAKNEAYSPAKKTWITKADMPTARSDLGAVAVDGIIYAIGGVFGAKNEAYNPITDTWSTKADMLTIHREFALVAVDGVIYAIGGGVSPYNKNEAYNTTTDTWSVKADMPVGRRVLGGAAIGDIIYAIGGIEDDNARRGLNSAYDTITNTWSEKAQILVDGSLFYSPIVAAIDGVLYAIGRGTNITLAYFPSSNRWRHVGGSPPLAHYATLASLDGTLYIMGGDPAYGGTHYSWDAKFRIAGYAYPGNIVYSTGTLFCGEQEIMSGVETTITDGGMLQALKEMTGYIRR